MAYNIVVLTREVLDTRDLTVDVLEGDQIKKSALSSRFEPEDLNALEMGLKIKDEKGGKVTAISVGGPMNVDVLRECLYRGIDDVIRISEDPSDLDTQALAAICAAAIRKIGDVNLVISGVNVSEGETALLGTSVAEKLQYDQVSYVDQIESITDDAITTKRAVEMGYEVIESQLPALINVGIALLQDDPRTPRSAKAMLKLKKKKVPITEWTLADLGIENAASLNTTTVSGRSSIEKKKIQSQSVEADNLDQLKNMLDQVMKGN